MLQKGNIYVLRLLLLLKVLGFNPESFLFDNLFKLRGQKEGRRVARIRARYNKKTPWLGKEEFLILRRILSRLFLKSNFD